ARTATAFSSRRRLLALPGRCDNPHVGQRAAPPVCALLRRVSVAVLTERTRIVLLGELRHECGALDALGFDLADPSVGPPHGDRADGEREQEERHVFPSPSLRRLAHFLGEERTGGALERV